MTSAASIFKRSTDEFSPEELDFLLQNIDSLSDEEASHLLEITQVLEERDRAQRCRDDLIEFCKAMQPDYLVGAHHRHLAKLLMEVESGEKDRITVSIAPRHGKSQITSIYYIAWYLGKHPTDKVMLVSHTADLAVDFGRKVRNLIASDEYLAVFPGVSLASDSKSAGRWNTNHGGEFFATGVGASIAGRGATLLVVDDPISEQALLAGDFSALEKTYEWFRSGARTRLMKGGRVAIVATRWHKSDLIGRLVRDMTLSEDVDQYEVVEFPAILNENTPDEKALWPDMFPLEVLHKTRASMPVYQWNAQYQQNPTGEESAILKREWWMHWEKTEPPKCEYIIMALDCASETGNRNDYTAMTVWGVWFNEETNLNNLILLNAVQQRMEFPELKQAALQWYREWQPDSFIVEKKSSGTPLYQELRRIGIPVSEFTPHRGTGDKVARLNAVADIVRSGLVWVPGTRWADLVVEEAAEFPYGEHDDLCDTLSMCLSRFRQGGFLALPSDEQDEPEYFKSRRGGFY
jgi:predicted phage terminase large subunit-like protein